MLPELDLLDLLSTLPFNSITWKLYVGVLCGVYLGRGWVVWSVGRFRSDSVAGTEKNRTNQPPSISNKFVRAQAVTHHTVIN